MKWRFCHPLRPTPTPMLRFGDTYYSVVVRHWGAPKSELLLQVMCLRTAPVLPTKRTETSVGLDFMGNFRQRCLPHLSTIGIALNLNFCFDSPCGVIGVEVRFEGTSLKIARAERFLRSIKWSDQNRTDFVPLHALRGSAPIRYAIVDGMTHPSLSRSSWQARSARIAPAVPQGATD